MLSFNEYTDVRDIFGPTADLLGPSGVRLYRQIRASGRFPVDLAEDVLYAAEDKDLTGMNQALSVVIEFARSEGFDLSDSLKQRP